jgi:hypothetical protein
MYFWERGVPPGWKPVLPGLWTPALSQKSFCNNRNRKWGVGASWLGRSALFISPDLNF